MNPQRQAEILSQIVQDHSEIAREIVNQGAPEDKIVRGAELARRSYEKTVTGIREVTDMASKSSREAGDIMSGRGANALTEIASSIEGQPAKAKKDAKAEGSKQAA